ncbi:MAG: PD40 domain-containing protein [Chloroflexi bacterium]|nr:PD40 domain-containing protein [Chloroflexota bacterium]
MTRRTRAILALLLCAAIAGVLAAAVISRLNNRIFPLAVPSGTLSFTTNARGHWDIALAPPDGDLVYLTPDDGQHNYFPSWDFSSERLNFLSNRAPDGDLAPTQVYPDGSNLRTLDILSAAATMFFENRLDWDPGYGPDGETLLWASLRDLNLELYTRSGEGAPLRLTNTPARDWFAQWSADGRRIAFSSDREGNEDIYVIDADGGNLRRVTTDPADDLRPTWSLDGQTLLFVSERETRFMDGALTLYAVNVAELDNRTDDTEESQPFDRAGSAFEGGGVFSADGRQIAYMALRDGHFQVFVMDIAEDGTFIRDSEKALTSGESDSMFPVWRP